MNAAAIASIAAGVEGVGGSAEARCFSEKRARKRFARGSVSDVSVLRRVRTAGSIVTPASCVGSIAEGAILRTLECVSNLSECCPVVGESSAEVKCWSSDVSALSKIWRDGLHCMQIESPDLVGGKQGLADRTRFTTAGIPPARTSVRQALALALCSESRGMWLV